MKHALVLSLFAATLLSAPVATAASTFPVDRMMVDTGLDQILVQLGDGVAHSAADSGVTDKSLLGQWQTVAGTMFKIERLNGLLGDALAQHPLSDDDQAALEKFYESDLGKRLIAAEVATDKLDDDQSQAAIDQGKTLTAKLSSRRTGQYARMWEIGSAPSVAIGNGLMRAGVLAVYLSRNHSGNSTVPWSAIDTTVDAVARRALPELRTNVNWANAYVYKDFTDDELDAYLDFLASPAGQHFYAISADALDEVIRNEVTRFGTTIAGAVNAIAI